MRRAKKTYPRAFLALLGILAIVLALFLIWLSFQPAESAISSQTQRTPQSLENTFYASCDSRKENPDEDQKAAVIHQQ